MLIMEMTEDAVTCDGLSVPAGDQAVFHLARLLRNAGFDRKYPVEVWRGGKKIFTASDLGWWAERSVAEGDAGVRMVKYRPFPTDAFAKKAEAPQ